MFERKFLNGFRVVVGTVVSGADVVVVSSVTVVASGVVVGTSVVVVHTVVLRDGVVLVLCLLVVMSETVRTVSRLGFARLRDKDPVTRPTDWFVAVCVSVDVVVMTVVVGGGAVVVVVVVVVDAIVHLVVGRAVGGGRRDAGIGQFLPVS